MQFVKQVPLFPGQERAFSVSQVKSDVPQRCKNSSNFSAFTDGSLTVHGILCCCCFDTSRLLETVMKKHCILLTYFQAR